MISAEEAYTKAHDRILSRVNYNLDNFSDSFKDKIFMIELKIEKEAARGSFNLKYSEKFTQEEKNFLVDYLNYYGFECRVLAVNEDQDYCPPFLYRFSISWSKGVIFDVWCH